MISIEEVAKINNLINSCDELISGKFILSEYKIAKILRDIGESKEVYKLLAQCMQNFNFERELSRAEIALPRKKFVLPEEPEKILPFVFCLLMEINNKKINLNSFLSDYYSDEENVDPFSKFANEVVKPFRNIIYNYFKDADEEEEQTPAPQQVEEQQEATASIEKSEEEEKIDNFFSECENICKDILSELEYERKKDLVDDAKYVVETMITACEEKNFRTLSALIISFGAMSESLKSIRFLTRELKNILISFFA